MLLQNNTGHQTQFTLGLGLIIMLLCAGYGTCARLQVLAIWQQSPGDYFVQDTPLMAGLDSYYSLRYARLYQAGGFQPEADDPLRYYQRKQYPVGTSDYWPPATPPQWAQQRQPRKLPALSWLLASTTPLFGTVEYAGIYLIPILSCLFMLPLFLYAHTLGYSAAGVLAVLLTGFAPLYWARTSIGWADTDALNLFFPWMASLLIVLMPRARSGKMLIGLAALLGITLYLYYRWYDKAAFTVLYIATMLLFLAINRISPKLILGCVAVTVFFSHPVQMFKSVENITRLGSRYLLGNNLAQNNSSFGEWFPNPMLAVSELKQASWEAPLLAILAEPYIVLTGLIAFVIFALMRARDIIPLIPLLIFAALSFFSGTRFAIYLAPFAGIGLGVLVFQLIAVALKKFSIYNARIQTIAHYIAVIVVFVALLPWSAAGQVAKPAINAGVYHSLLELKALLLPGARIWSWWDSGFAISYATDAGVYHDGSAQYTPQTNLVAYSFSTDKQQEMYNTLMFVDQKGNNGIERLAVESDGRNAFLKRLTSHQGLQSTPKPLYVLYTSDMIGKFGAIRFVAGMAAAGSIHTGGYLRLRCRDLHATIFRCDDVDVNMSTGILSDGKPLAATHIVEDGARATTLQYQHESNLHLQLIIREGELLDIYLLSDEVFKSNLNQMFLLGKYDSDLFEELYNNYPIARLFRVRGAPD